MLVLQQRSIVGWGAVALLAFACDGKPNKFTGRDEEAGAGGEAPAATAPDGEGGMAGAVLEPAGGEAPATGATAAGGAFAATGGMAAPAGGTAPGVAGTGAIIPTAGAGGAQGLPLPTPLANAPQQPANLQAALGFIYFTDIAGRVRRVDPAGGQPQDVGTVPQPQGSTTPPAFVMHGARAYVAGSPAAGAFAVYELPAAGGAPVVRFNTPALASALLADDTAVYYAAQAAITRVTLSDSQPAPLAQGVPPSPSLALNATHLYFALSTGAVNAVPIAGGTIVPLAAQQGRQETHEKYLRVLVRLAARLRDQAPTLLQVSPDFVAFVHDEAQDELARETIAPERFQALFSATAEDARQRAQLGQKPPAERIEQLVAALGSFGEGVSSEFARAELARLGAFAIPALLPLLEHPKRRWMAAKLLGEIGCATPEVIAALRPHATKELWAPIALGMLGDNAWLTEQSPAVAIDGLAAPLKAISTAVHCPPLDYAPLEQYLDRIGQPAVQLAEESLAPGSSYRSLQPDDLNEALRALASPHAVTAGTPAPSSATAPSAKPPAS